MGKKRVYAAIDGKTVKTFTAWGPCNKFVKGRHIVYKGFETERAMKIWLEARKEKDENVEPDIEVYTDGSLIRHGNQIQMGFACYFKYKEEEFEASQHITKERFSELSPGSVYEDILRSSSLAEVCGVAFALKHLPRVNCVKIYVDNMNAVEWLNGGFNVNKKYLEVLIDDIKTLMEAYPHVYIKHVRGHSGSHGNEHADKLAYAAANDPEKCDFRFNKI